MTHPDFTQHGYQILSELGHNRAGGRITYKATEINTNNTVVLKQFQFARTGSNWSDYDAYQREIEILKRLDHPNIPRYLDSFQTASGFCMIQEYKNAPSLAIPQPWKPHQVKQIAISVLEILIYLQNRIPPVIHRDLKPENILVDDKLNVSLVDFGFARLGGGEVAVSSVVKGTLGFMPPEQMFNRQLTTASDLYSLGATLICLLTQINSLEVGSLIDDYGKINFKARVPSLSDEFIQWLEKLVEPQGKNRYSNAQNALEALIPITVLRPPVKTKRSFWLKLGIAAASIGIFSPVGINYYFQHQSQQMTALGSVRISMSSDPSYNLNQISLQEKAVNFRIGLSNLEKSKYVGVCQLFDPQERLVAFGHSIFESKNGNIKADCGYQFNPSEDKPGDWKFKFFLDGQTVLQKTINVLP